MDRLSGLTVERLADLSQRMFTSKPTVAAVGPVGELAPFETIRSQLASAGSTPRKLAV